VSPLVDVEETIGAVLRTRAGVQPVFISIGHRADLESAIEIALACTDGYRVPKPTREADHFVEQLKRGQTAPEKFSGAQPTSCGVAGADEGASAQMSVALANGSNSPCRMPNQVPRCRWPTGSTFRPEARPKTTGRRRCRLTVGSGRRQFRELWERQQQSKASERRTCG